MIRSQARYALARAPIGTLVRKSMAKPFARSATLRVLVVFAPNRISFSQVYPFAYYQREFLAEHGTQFRFISTDHLLNANSVAHLQADLIILQSWLTDPIEVVHRVLQILKETSPAARVTYFDSFANSDIRLARILEPYVNSYFKKAIFKDPQNYYRSFVNDTNLTDYYSGLYGLSGEPVDWQVPDNFHKRLRVGPHFFTGPEFISGFLAKAPDTSSETRPFDLHYRGETEGTEWYTRMRTDAQAKICALEKINVVAGKGVPWKQFMRELNQSKLCFSPFGYGEVCWRDIEAIIAGSVLIKPNMDHLTTNPDIYVPWKTYIPIRWDFADLEEKVREILADDILRQEIANNAHSTVKRYLSQKTFVSDMAKLIVDT